MMNEISRNKVKIVLVSGISAVAGAANIWLMMLINRSVRLTEVEPRSMAQFGAVLGLMVSVIFLSQILLSRLSAKAFFNLRDQLVRGINSLSAQQIEAIGNHRLYTALTKDVPAVHDLIAMLPTYVYNGTLVVACMIYLGLLSATLFAMFLVFLLLALGVSKFAIADRAEKKFKLRRQVEDDLFRCYEAVIEGNKELKFNHARSIEFIDRDLRGHAEQYRKATLAAETLWNLSSSWSTAVIFIGIGALLYLSPALGVTDRTDVLSFVIVIFYMVAPLNVLMNSFRTIYGAKVGLAKLEELRLGLPTSAVAAPPAPAPFRSLSLRDVSFTYAGHEEGREGFSVGPLNLEIVSGEIVYFVGGNGSGKTTAAKLLTGLYAKQRGALLINGKEAEGDAAAFETFSAVFQDYYLFDTLVPKGGGRIDEALAAELIERLRLTDKVTIKNGRISTTKLSYGQRKRLALLVAYFDESSVYVFDEWAADQDPEFREFFYKELLFDLKRRGKTIVAVSHDDRYFHLSDKLVKFENGKIVSIVRKNEQRTADAEPLEALGA